MMHAVWTTAISETVLAADANGLPREPPAGSPLETIFQSLTKLWRDLLEHLPFLAGGVLLHRECEVFAREFALSSVNFEVCWWTKSTPLEVRRSRDEVVALIKRELDDAGIEIPFPYRTLTFRGPVPISGTAQDDEQVDVGDEPPSPNS